MDARKRDGAAGARRHARCERRDSFCRRHPPDQYRALFQCGVRQLCRIEVLGLSARQRLEPKAHGFGPDLTPERHS